MPVQQTYSPEEIKKWKEMIYGNNNMGVKVDEWASAETSSAMQPPRKHKQKQKWGKSPGQSPSYSEDNWLTGESPTKAKKAYKTKGDMNTSTPF